LLPVAPDHTAVHEVAVPVVTGVPPLVEGKVPLKVWLELEPPPPMAII
jgi:hypothetical protein